MSRHPVLTGLVGGFVWGSVLRLWMRYISTHPEFSWSGTLFIVGAAAVAGLVLGVLWWRAGGSRWWRLIAVGILPAFGGAGIIMLPSVLVGAAGLGRTNWLRPVRLGMITVALGAQYAFLGLGEEFPEGRMIPALAWYTVMIGIEMWAVSVLFRPKVPIGALFEAVTAR
jgi:hypothetical protein